MPVLGDAPRDTGARLLGRAVWLIVLGLAAALVPTGAVAADAAPTISVVPASVTLRIGEEAELEVLVTNPTTVPTYIDRIAPASTPGITTHVEPGDGPAVPIAPGTSVVRTLRVTPTRELEDAQVGLVLSSHAAGSPVQTATATLTISTAATTAPVLTFLVAPDSLDDGENRATTVRIDNSAGPALQSVSLAAMNGDDVSIRLPTSKVTSCDDAADGSYCLGALGAGASVLLHVETVADESVHTGTQQVGLVLTADPGTGQPTVTSTATHDVTLTVFGVDALSPFGIGTLFVLPGLLAVVFFLLGNAIYPRTKALPDQADIKDLRQFPFVVGVSALVYLVAWVGFKQDLTATVSTTKVALMMVGGALIGTLAWGVMALIYGQVVGPKVFRLDDKPRRVLERLKARGASLYLPGFTAGGLQYARLAPAADGKVYASPRIAYAYQGAAADKASERQELGKAIDGGQIQPLLDAEKSGLVTLSWANLDGVRTFDESAAVVTGQIRLPEEASAAAAQAPEAPLLDP